MSSPGDEPRAPGPGAENTRLRAVIAAMRELSGEVELDHLMERSAELAAPLVNADRVSLFMYDRERDELWARIPEGLTSLEIRMPAARGLAGSCARSGEVVNVPDAYADPRFNPEVDRRTGYRTRSVLCVPARDRGEVVAVMQALNRTGEGGGGAFSDADAGLLETIAGAVAVALTNALLHERVELLLEGFLRASSRAIEGRDPTTAGHSRRVASYAVSLARACHDAGVCGFTRARLKQLRYAALLHDVGKIGVRERVLNKSGKLSAEGLALVRERLRRLAIERPGEVLPDEAAALVGRVSASGFLADEDAEAVRGLERAGLITKDEARNLLVRRGNLTEDEWSDMRGHVLHGRRFLDEIPWTQDLRRVPEIAQMHHEKLDGSGYPLGLCGPDIDTDARILEIADIYDALTARDRPYKPAVPHERARGIVEDMASKGELDGRLVRLFFEKEAHAAGDGSGTRVVAEAAER